MNVAIPPFVGLLFDKRGALVCLFILAVNIVIAYALYLMVGVSGGLVVALFAFIFFGGVWGVGNGFALPLAISKVKDQAEIGTVSAAAITILNVSGVVSLSIATTIFHVVEQHTLKVLAPLNSAYKSQMAFVAGLHMLVWVFGIISIAVVALCILFLLRKTHKPAMLIK